MLRLDKILTILLCLTIILVLLTVSLLVFRAYGDSSASATGDKYLYNDKEQLQAIEDTAIYLQQVLEIAYNPNAPDDCELPTSIWITSHAAKANAEAILSSYKAKPSSTAIYDMELAIQRLVESTSGIVFGCSE